jgi:agmatinase
MSDNAWRRQSTEAGMTLSEDYLYSGPVTFMGAPYTHDLRGAKAAVLGIPFDCGTHPHRIGSRQGPQAIREQSAQMRLYNSELADFNPVERLKLVDCGNVKLTPSRIVDAFERIEAAVRLIHEAAVIPVTMGGDGSISLPLLRAAARHGCRAHRRPHR